MAKSDQVKAAEREIEIAVRSSTLLSHLRESTVTNIHSVEELCIMAGLDLAGIRALGLDYSQYSKFVADYKESRSKLYHWIEAALSKKEDAARLAAGRKPH